MRRGPIFVIIAAVVLSLVAFIYWLQEGRQEDRENLSTVLILQDKPQEWADALKLGFYDGLGDAGKELGRDVVVGIQSAAGESSSLVTLAETAARSKYKSVYTLGTQASQAYFEPLPADGAAMVFGAVTDPVAAGFYDGSLERPRKNLTGTQDLWPYKGQFELFRRLLPTAKKIGTLYNGGEVNSQVSVRYAREAAEEQGFKLLEKVISTDQEVALATSALLAEGVDALYIPADNTAQASSSLILSLAAERRVPVFTGISGIVENGAIATVGTNYYEVGRVNGLQVAKIIDGIKASEIPVGIADKGDIYINSKAARELGIPIPDDVKKRAFKIYE